MAYEVMALWEDFPPEVHEEWPTEREAIRSAYLNNLCRDSEYVRYVVRRKPEGRETSGDEECRAAPPPQGRAGSETRQLRVGHSCNGNRRRH